MYITIIVSSLLILSSILNLILAIQSSLIMIEFCRLKKSGHNGIVTSLHMLFVFITISFIWNFFIGIQNLPLFEVVVINSHGYFRVAAILTKIAISIVGIIILEKFGKVWRNG